jgi:formate dehydrogenase major subunit
VGAHGDITNDLGAISGEPNVSIQESKAFCCDVRAGRRRGPSTRRLAGVAPPESPIATNQDDPSAENPKEVAP